jgi:probable phosphoglycerate mutase
MARRRLKNTYFLMRHEETRKNRRDLISSAYRRYPVTPRGRAAARRAAAALALFDLDRVYTSPFRRARETAAIVAAACGAAVAVDRDLRELTVGRRFESKPWENYLAEFRSQAERFRKRLPGCETVGDVERRVVRALRRYERRHRGQTILVVSHGDPLWVLKAWLLGLTSAAAARRRAALYLSTGEVQMVVPHGRTLGFVRLCEPTGGKSLAAC